MIELVKRAPALAKQMRPAERIAVGFRRIEIRTKIGWTRFTRRKELRVSLVTGQGTFYRFWHIASLPFRFDNSLSSVSYLSDEVSEWLNKMDRTKIQTPAVTACIWTIEGLVRGKATAPHLVADDAGGELGHDVGAVRVEGDVAETLGLALGAEVAAGLVKTVQGGVVGGVDVHLNAQLEGGAGGVLNDQVLLGQLVGTIRLL
eukprot:7798327-Pyramimonas_sp.AAC.1